MTLFGSIDDLADYLVGEQAHHHPSPPSPNTEGAGIAAGVGAPGSGSARPDRGLSISGAAALAENSGTLSSAAFNQAAGGEDSRREGAESGPRPLSAAEQLRQRESHQRFLEDFYRADEIRGGAGTLSL